LFNFVVDLNQKFMSLLKITIIIQEGGGCESRQETTRKGFPKSIGFSLKSLPSCIFFEWINQ